MSIFGNIMSAIFGHPAAAAPQHAAPNSATARAAGTTGVDVAAVMDKLAAQTKQKLNWRKSIVDLMKLLNLDSSLAARQHLARELHYAGNTKDTAPMNIWLHKQVMIKLAENGGSVPDELKR